MTDARSVDHTGLLRAGVGVCAFGGVFLFVWAATSGYGPAFGVAVALWVVGGVLSAGITHDAEPEQKGGSDAEDSLQAHPGESMGSARDGVGSRTGTSADALQELRRRYARGDMTEAEFEHRVERLLATDPAEEADDALRTLRQRYARGDLSDEQFDRKRDRLTETRTLEDATDTDESGDPTGD